MLWLLKRQEADQYFFESQFKEHIPVHNILILDIPVPITT
ncbi:MAG: hypothetical protein OJF51_000655 [Nitrospira sp.]|nr:MAG: hypothetical protein OJF51_000655 [Nitrospira sp.]